MPGVRFAPGAKGKRGREKGDVLNIMSRKKGEKGDVLNIMSRKKGEKGDVLNIMESRERKGRKTLRKCRTSPFFPPFFRGQNYGVFRICEFWEGEN